MSVFKLGQSVLSSVFFHHLLWQRNLWDKGTGLHRPDVLPVTLLTASKHWSKPKAQDQSRTGPHLLLDSHWKEVDSFMSAHNAIIHKCFKLLPFKIGVLLRGLDQSTCFQLNIFGAVVSLTAIHFSTKHYTAKHNTPFHEFTNVPSTISN